MSRKLQQELQKGMRQRDGARPRDKLDLRRADLADAHVSTEYTSGVVTPSNDEDAANTWWVKWGRHLSARMCIFSVPMKLCVPA